MKTPRILSAGIVFLLFLIAPSAVAQLFWDTNPGAAGVQGGTGNWIGTNFWNNTSTNVAWVNGNSAIFAGRRGRSQSTVP